MRLQSPFTGKIRGLFTFALLCVFALCACLLLLSGLQVYKSVSVTAADNYNGRTTLLYIMNKLRSGARAEASSSDLLILCEDIDDRPCNTYIYCRDGKLCEYFAPADRAFDADLGEPIADASQLLFSQEKELLRVTLITTSGEAHEACCALRTSGTEVS